MALDIDVLVLQRSGQILNARFKGIGSKVETRDPIGGLGQSPGLFGPVRLVPLVDQPGRQRIGPTHMGHRVLGGIRQEILVKHTARAMVHRGRGHQLRGPGLSVPDLDVAVNGPEHGIDKSGLPASCAPACQGHGFMDQGIHGRERTVHEFIHGRSEYGQYALGNAIDRTVGKGLNHQIDECPVAQRTQDQILALRLLLCLSQIPVQDGCDRAFGGMCQSQDLTGSFSACDGHGIILSFGAYSIRRPAGSVCH